MIREAKIALTILVVALIVGAFSFGLSVGRNEQMAEAKYTLKTYTGVGSGVFKHGTIVKVVDGQPVVVGNFDDSGKEFPGTLEIEKVQ